MSLHDDFIKKAYKEIEKLTADIEKKKSRIVELRASIKKHEADRTRDSEFSDTILRLLSDNGILFLKEIQISQQQHFLKILPIRIN